MALFRGKMAKSTVSFEQLDREHRRERADDALRLRTGRTTPGDLQRENSLFPAGAVFKFDLAAHLARPRRSK